MKFVEKFVKFLVSNLKFFKNYKNKTNSSLIRFYKDFIFGQFDKNSGFFKNPPQTSNF